MDILIALKQDADQPAFIARAATAGVEIERIEGLPRHFRASWPDMASFPLRDAPEVLDAVDGSERIGAPQVSQGLTIGSAPGLIDGDSWALARIVRRRAPWDTRRIRTPVSTTFQSARDGSGVDIYILDTGVDLDHPSFGGRAATVYEIVSSGGLGDDQGHGTLCASVALGDAVGVARGSLLWSIKITDGDGSTTNSAFSTCVGQMNSHYDGRSGTGRPAVCTCSWVFPTTLYIDSVIAAAVDAGIVMVGAAGNSMDDLATTSSYPAEFADVLCVAGTGPADTPFYKGYAGTSYGDVEVDILAPAYQVKCAQAYVLDTGRGYFFKDGTSLAAPLVAGVVACLLEGHSRLADRADVQAVNAHLLSIATTGKYRAAPEFGIGDLPDRILYLDPAQVAPETIIGL